MPRSRQALLLAAADGPIEIAVREHARQRRLRLHVRGGDVLLTVPPRTSRAQIERFVSEQRRWIDETLLREHARASQLGLRRRGVVWRFGEPLSLVHLGRGRAGASLSEGRLLVRGAGAEAAGAIKRWYREETRRVAEAAIARESQALGVTVSRLRIADQRSRWGSASTRGTISLNWRLLLAPPEIFDYVLVHELCHLRELNHSPQFWALVAAARPAYREQKRWLDRHGGELRAWRPTDALGLCEV